jgi:predicted TIM-barrel fold metal-dependent hydrolase
MVIDFRVRPPIVEAYPEIPELAHYGDLYKHSTAATRDDIERGWEVLLEQMDEADVQIALLVAEDYEATLGKKVRNEAIAEGVRMYPDRFRGLASVDPHKGKAAVEELEHAVKDLGMVGLTLWPCFHEMYCTDRRYYPLYEKCRELGIFVVIHTSVNFSKTASLDLGRPVYLDQVAMDFPDLTIVASHAGWPWVLEMIAVAWRHPNVLMETSAMRPKHMMKEHSGWGPLFNYGNSILSDRIMFATAWPLLPFKRSVDEFRQFPLKEEVKEKWLHGNAARLLGLEED